MGIEREERVIGPPPGRKVEIFTLTAGELVFRLSSLGAAWLSLLVPSRKTGAADVLLGYGDLADYGENRFFLGATIGRFANRIGGARFRLNGRDYALGRNDGNHCLHGGPDGFHARVWQADAWEEGDAALVRFTLDSPDGDGGFPGSLRATVTYALDGSGTIRADYRAELDAPSPVSLTNHAYFNLAGQGDVLSHNVTIHASRRLERDAEGIPTGKILPIGNGAGITQGNAGTAGAAQGDPYDFRAGKVAGQGNAGTAVGVTQSDPYDFRAGKAAGRDLAGTAGGNGYDDCYVLDGEAGTLRPCAEVFDEASGRSLRILATQPGLQFYTGNFLDRVPGKNGAVYGKYGGLCLETQAFPDSPNRPGFPDAVYGPARPYHEEARFIFGW